jgi:hypothetical protein
MLNQRSIFFGKIEDGSWECRLFTVIPVRRRLADCIHNMPFGPRQSSAHWIDHSDINASRRAVLTLRFVEIELSSNESTFLCDDYEARINIPRCLTAPADNP